jgi:hypothetical protein
LIEQAKERKKRAHALIALSLISSMALLAEPALRGTVTDEADASIPAVILIHWDSRGSRVGLLSNVGIKEDLIVRTGRDGSFSIDLPSGFYDVFVSSPSFTPVCRKIRILERKTVTFQSSIRARCLGRQRTGLAGPVIARQPTADSSI